MDNKEEDGIQEIKKDIAKQVEAFLQEMAQEHTNNKEHAKNEKAHVTGPTETLQVPQKEGIDKVKPTQLMNPIATEADKYIEMHQHLIYREWFNESWPEFSGNDGYNNSGSTSSTMGYAATTMISDHNDSDTHAWDNTQHPFRKEQIANSSIENPPHYEMQWLQSTYGDTGGTIQQAYPVMAQEWQQDEFYGPPQTTPEWIMTTRPEAGQTYVREEEQLLIQELWLIDQMATFSKTDISKTGKLASYDLGIWVLHQIWPVTAQQRWELDALHEKLFTKESWHDKYKAVDYAINEGSHTIIQKLYLIGTKAQKIRMLNVLGPSYRSLASNKYGCLVLQQIFAETTENMDPAKPRRHYTLYKQVVYAFDSLLIKDEVIQICNDPHGNYVMLRWAKMLKQIPKMDIWEGRHPNDIFNEILIDNIANISINKIGCRIILRLLEDEDSPRQLTHKAITNLLTDEKLELIIPTEGGNFVAQNIMEKGHTEAKIQLVTHIGKNFQRIKWEPERLFYANNDLARHVLQKCFERQENPEVQEAQSKVLNMVLKPNGSPAFPFSHRQMDGYVLKMMQKCQQDQQRSRQEGKRHTHRQKQGQRQK